MKTKHTLQTLLLVCGMLATTTAGYAQKAVVQIKLSNIQNAKGTLYFGFYKRENDFPAFGKAAFNIKAASNGSSILTINVPQMTDGQWAIAAFQDLNGNGKLDTKMFGIPKEPYAFSNDFHPKLSKPKFDDCKVIVDEAHRSFSIELIN